LTPKGRVLLYYGNGGVGAPTGDPVAYNTLADLFEKLGYYVDYTNMWPSQFGWTTRYKLIVLLAPGHDSGDRLAGDGFSIGQKVDLDSFLQQDGTLAIMSDATSFTGQDVENDLLKGLPVDLKFNGGNFTSGHGDQITANCLTTNLGVYSALDAANNWTDVASPGGTASPGTLIKQNASSTQGANLPMYMADVPSHGNGMVIILGDLHGLSDDAHMGSFNWPADNERIPYNWVSCDP
jgi:hypothetical protein